MHTAALRYIRRVIYTLSIGWTLLLYYVSAITYPETAAALSNLMRLCGLTSLSLLFITLTPGLIQAYFPRFLFNPILLKARRALGISTFYFGLLHVVIGFFNNLSGRLEVIQFLIDYQKIAVILGLLAFTILLLMALSSFDSAIRVLGARRWKLLHRGIYVAAILVVFHAFLIGSHFTIYSNTVPTIIRAVSLTYLILEAGATIKRTIEIKRNSLVRKGIVSVLAIAIVVAGIFVSRYAARQVYVPHTQHTHDLESK